MGADDGPELHQLIHAHRERLTQLLERLSGDGAVLSAEDARVLVDSTIRSVLDLLEIEQQLQPSPGPVFPRTLERVRRIRALSKPRIGRLVHYPPKRLEVPADYLSTPMPPEAPTISIVTPCFQHGRFLERTVRSVLAQKYPALEYFVQDGGSTDETLAVLERCGEELDGWVSERDSGQADAINRGFQRTSGEIMAWLNSDDLLLPGSLAYVGAYFAEHPEVDVVYGNRIMIDDNDGQIGAWILPRHDDLALTLADYVPQETLFWRRRIWDAAGGLDPTFDYALDWDLLLRFRSAGAMMVRLPRFIGAFRIHARQKTSSTLPLGGVEMARLRERVYGRPVPVSELNERLRPYFRRHVVLHLRQRVLDRLPLSRLPVPVAPRPESAAAESVELQPPEPAPASLAPGPPSGERSMSAQPDVRPPTLRVAVDLGCIVPGTSGGLVNVIEGTLNELFERRPDFRFVVFCTPSSHGLIRERRGNVELVTLPARRFYAELDWRLDERNADVLLRGYPTLEPISFPIERQIVVIPDLLHELRPEMFAPDILEMRRAAFQRPLEAAGAIATISAYARSTIVQDPRHTPDVFVMYPSVPREFTAATSAEVTPAERALVPDGEFFFYPANLWPHKNHERLLEAVARAVEQSGRPIELVLTGALDGWDELIASPAAITVRHLGYVRTPLLRLLYERATALTFFSLHEGFGIPILEAFAAGTPVLCSNLSSMPEVAGDAALMCDPCDVAAMADAMVEIASDTGVRDVLIERGKERLQRFQWSQAADQLASALTRVHLSAESARSSVRGLGRPTR